MYHLYHTHAFVLASRPLREGSKRLLIFTREFGMIDASARSIREERSRLRYALQDFSYAEVALVRGRSAWRITGARRIGSAHADFRDTPEAIELFARVFVLLRRLLAGEEKNAPLFDAVAAAHAFLREQPQRARELASAEPILLLRILLLLGYLSPRPSLRPFVEDALLWRLDALEAFRAVRRSAIRDINESLRATQL